MITDTTYVLESDTTRKQELTADGYAFTGEIAKSHGTNFPQDGWNSTTKTTEISLTRERWQKKSYVNATFMVGEHNGYDDSDFYAVVWDANKNALIEVVYASTRFAGGGYADIDADEVHKDLAELWLSTWAFRRMKIEYEEDSKLPKAGRAVRVVSGRKVKIGTVATAAVYCEGHSFDYGRTHPMRVHLTNDDGLNVWTDAHNVEVIDQRQYIPSEHDLANCAIDFAHRVRVNNNWYSSFIPELYLFVK